MSRLPRLPWWWALALLGGLTILGLYSLIVWTFFMQEGGWQIGLASFILLTAPTALMVYLTGKYRPPEPRQADEST